ncbi:MAG: NAD(P)-dependent oxidoreductase [Phycisphaerales bacterium]
MHKRKIALIGGAGFIGHNLALALSSRGADVFIIDSLRVNNLLAFSNADPSTPNRDLYLRLINERQRLLRAADIPVYTQDARDEQALVDLLGMIRPQVLVHLAGISHADRSNRQPHDAFEHTLHTLENTLACARDWLEHFIFFSSSMVYGHFCSGIVTEETPCNPIGIYGALKFSGEKLVIAHNQVFGLPYTIIRPAALYGHRCVSRRVVQVFIENARGGETLTVAGDGAERLDFTFIEDLITGIIQIIQSDESRGETFNLTFGRSRSIAELVEVVRAQFPKISIEYRPKNRLMPDRGTLCVDKARALLGYDPHWPIERGVAQYIKSYGSLGEPSLVEPKMGGALVAP